MPSLILLRDELGLDTRDKNHIDNYLDRRPLIAGAVQKSRDLRRQYSNARHRPTSPCATYNCHGLTFASRRTGIDPTMVRKILTEDGYEQVTRTTLVAGDIAVYVHPLTNDFEHSGIVIEVNQFGPLILSKWGDMHEVIHRLSDCEYDASNVQYYRLFQ